MYLIYKVIKNINNNNLLKKEFIYKHKKENMMQLRRHI